MAGGQTAYRLASADEAPPSPLRPGDSPTTRIGKRAWGLRECILRREFILRASQGLVCPPDRFHTELLAACLSGWKEVTQRPRLYVLLVRMGIPERVASATMDYLFGLSLIHI